MPKIKTSRTAETWGLKYTWQRTASSSGGPGLPSELPVLQPEAKHPKKLTIPLQSLYDDSIAVAMYRQMSADINGNPKY
jgi:hypothetical protein